MSERIAAFVDGLSTFLIGVSMVFVALVLLILLINIVGKLVANLENRKAAQTLSKPDATPQVVSELSEPVVSASECVDELELIAVITATIAASLGTTSDKLQVRSLRKVERRPRTF
ncbi:MAG: OadG family protein [Cellulosilyticaceae bacterium]